MALVGFGSSGDGTGDLGEAGELQDACRWHEPPGREIEIAAATRLPRSRPFLPAPCTAGCSRLLGPLPATRCANRRGEVAPHKKGCSLRTGGTRPIAGPPPPHRGCEHLPGFTCGCCMPAGYRNFSQISSFRFATAGTAGKAALCTGCCSGCLRNRCRRPLGWLGQAAWMAAPGAELAGARAAVAASDAAAGVHAAATAGMAAAAACIAGSPGASLAVVPAGPGMGAASRLPAAEDGAARGSGAKAGVPACRSYCSRPSSSIASSSASATAPSAAAPAAAAAACPGAGASACCC